MRSLLFITTLSLMAHTSGLIEDESIQDLLSKFLCLNVVIYLGLSVDILARCTCTKGVADREYIIE